MMQVTISNDEELIIALTEMPGPLYKLSLSLKGNKKPAVTTETSDTGEEKVEEARPAKLARTLQWYK